LHATGSAIWKAGGRLSREKSHLFVEEDLWGRGQTGSSGRISCRAYGGREKVTYLLELSEAGAKEEDLGVGDILAYGRGGGEIRAVWGKGALIGESEEGENLYSEKSGSKPPEEGGKGGEATSGERKSSRYSWGRVGVADRDFCHEGLGRWGGKFSVKGEGNVVEVLPAMETRARWTRLARCPSEKWNQKKRNG